MLDVTQKWEKFRKTINEVFKIDKHILENRHSFRPTYHIAFECGECGQVNWALVIVHGRNPIHEKAKVLMTQVEYDVRQRSCPKCKETQLRPIGYIFCSDDPYRKEVYSMFVTTRFGKAALAKADIMREKDKVIVGDLKVSETRPDDMVIDFYEDENVMFG